MATPSFAQAIGRWFLWGCQIRQAIKQHEGHASFGFAGADIVEPHFSLFPPFGLTGFTLYYRGGIGSAQQVEECIKRGTRIVVVAKNIGDLAAKNLVLAGAIVNLIDFDTRPIRMFNLVLDGIRVHSFLRNAGHGQVLDLKTEGRSAQERGGKGGAIVYVLGNFPPAFVSRVDENGRRRMQGCGKREDIMKAGGIPIDMGRYQESQNGSSILSYALHG